ncbi:MAG: gamma-glutamyltransferase [Gammaproteobacteria bacterium]|nr:gamma-glutamyltransferase [Gammaproteobacteria bacterium]
MLVLVAPVIHADGLEEGQGPGKAAVATAHPLATAAAFEIFEQGGNAFDAAVAASAALGVVEPQSSGFGGGGFWLLHRAADAYEVMVDGRETAPAAATRDMYVNADGKPNRAAALTGPLAAGIPGLLAGLAYISETHGYLTFGEALAPAIRLARDGFPVSEQFHATLARMRDRLASDPGSAAIFLQDGKVPPVGAIIRQPALAHSLQLIAEHGVEEFYKGQVASDLVAGVRAMGGIWTEADLADYVIRLREPVRFTYRDMTITSAPPPSSGGIVLAQALNILERFDISDMDKGTRDHLVIEAMRQAYRDRAAYLGDPDFVDIDIGLLTSKRYAAERAALIDMTRATASADLPAVTAEEVPEGTDTTHFSVIDADGNRVGGTLSINIPFGAGVLEPVTGVILNDEMDDFAQPNMVPNSYGLVGAKANEIAAGKRPLSSMSPTFIETDSRVAILGTPGGSRIITMVLLGILDFEVGHPPASWVAVPRFHHQYLPDVVEFETAAFSDDEQEGLMQRGYSLKESPRRYGDMHAIEWNKSTGEVSAASDPRGEGLAEVR